MIVPDNTPDDVLNHMNDLQQEVERLTLALGSIARNSCCSGCQEAARVARAALAFTHCTCTVARGRITENPDCSIHRSGGTIERYTSGLSTK